MSTWRTVAAQVIYDVIRKNPNDDEKTLRAKISAAYPFGERAHFPYKVWLSEVKAQMGKRFQAEIEWPEWLKGKSA